MAPTKRDLSGVFDAELRQDRSRKTAVLEHVSRLSDKGITFVSQTQMPKWTEVGVEMRMPVKGVRKDQQISCRGVVVQCTRRLRGAGYEVALLFLDLPKRAQVQLDVAPVACPPLSISIAR